MKNDITLPSISASLSGEKPETLHILKAIESMLSPYKNTDWQMTIEIPYSKSSKFKQVRKLIKEKIRHNEQDACIEVFVELDKIKIIDKLFKLVKSWKELLIKWGDEEIDKHDFASWIRCYRERVKFKGKNDFFCYGASMMTANIFGCHRTMIRESPLAGQVMWWDRGKFEGDIYQIDKPRICDHIHKKLKPYKFCPALEYSKIERAIRAIPNTVNPQTDRIFVKSSIREGIEPQMIPLEIIDGVTFKISRGQEELALGIYFQMPTIPVSPFYLAVLGALIKESGMSDKETEQLKE